MIPHAGKLSALVLAATLAGCAVPVKPPPPAAERPEDALEALPPEAADAIRAARRALAEAAQAADPAARYRLQLQAANLYLQADRLDEASRALASLAEPAPEPALAFEARLVRAELAVRRAQPGSALEQLQLPAGETPLPEPLLIRFYRLRASAYALEGNALEAANELLLLEGLLVEESQIADNQARILQYLSTLTSEALEQLQVMAPTDLAGWLELARLAREPLDGAQFLREISRWRNRYDDHPALAQTLERLGARLTTAPLIPRQIAVLLPATGPFIGPASALREGLLAAYYASPDSDRPALRFYGVAEDGSNAREVLARAVEAGAELVVGPLTKGGVTAIATLATLPVPVLALNQAELPEESALPTNLYQFGLLPEDEARLAAEKAWLEGYTRALVLAPDGLWGARVATSFRQRWEALGGTILEQQAYDARQSDFSGPIQALLDIDDSQRRRSQLQRILGTPLKFEPRRRQDAEVLFVAAFPRQARLIRPQLRFFRGGNLPVLATSHVFTGTVDRKADSDLDDVLFPDTPWTLDLARPTRPVRQAVANLWPDRVEQFARLFAMGFDAYRLIPHINRLQADPAARFEGETGTLALDTRGRIHRRLPWARFRRGAPDLIGFAPEPEALALPSTPAGEPGAPGG